jgi:hypothetical protein
MLTGGSVGGSLRFAAKDVLNTSDSRRSAEAQDERQIRTQESVDRRSERNRLLAFNYPPDKVDAYLNSKGKDAKLLGDPVTTQKESGAAPRSVTPSAGKYRDREFRLTQRKTMQGTTEVGTEWGTMVNGKWVTEAELPSKVGSALTAWESGTHSETAIAKQLDTVRGEFQKNTEALYTAANAGAKNDANTAGFLAPAEIAQRAITIMNKDLGFDIRNPAEKDAMQQVYNNATKSMMEAQKNGVKVKSIDPFIHAQIIQFRTGLSEDEFMTRGGKPMGPETIKQLVDTAQQIIGPKKDVTHLMNRMLEVYKANPALQKEHGTQGGNSQSGFYHYARTELKKLQDEEAKTK